MALNNQQRVQYLLGLFDAAQGDDSQEGYSADFINAEGFEYIASRVTGLSSGNFSANLTDDQINRIAADYALMVAGYVDKDDRPYFLKRSDDLRQNSTGRSVGFFSAKPLSGATESGSDNGGTPGGHTYTADDSTLELDGNTFRVKNGGINIQQLGATGTASATTFLRGDNTWASITDNDTTYSADDSTLELSGTQFSIKNRGVGIDQLAATGTPGSTTFLRGDNTWAVPPGAGGISGSDVPDHPAHASTVKKYSLQVNATPSEAVSWTEAFSGSYNDLTNKPTLFSGSYADLTNKPTIPDTPSHPAHASTQKDYVLRVAATPGTSVSWNELTDNDTTYTADGTTLELSSGEFSVKDGGIGTAQITDASVSLAKLSATGTRDSVHWLRGDNTFANLPENEALVLQATGTQTGVWNSGDPKVYTRNTRRNLESDVDTSSEWNIQYSGGATAIRIGGGNYVLDFPQNSLITIQVDNGDIHTGTVFSHTYGNISPRNYTQILIVSNPFNLANNENLTSGTTLTVTDINPTDDLLSGVMLDEGLNQFIRSSTDRNGNTRSTISGYWLRYSSASVPVEASPAAHEGELIYVVSDTAIGSGNNAGFRTVFRHISGPRYFESGLSAQVGMYQLTTIDDSHAGGIELTGDGIALVVPLDKMVADAAKVNRTSADRGKGIRLSTTDENEVDLFDIFSGSYNDLTDKPTLFSGSYNDLTNRPTLFSGSYNDLTNKPTLFSGSYNDLTNKPARVGAFTAADEESLDIAKTFNNDLLNREELTRTLSTNLSTNKGEVVISTGNTGANATLFDTPDFIGIDIEDSSSNNQVTVIESAYPGDYVFIEEDADPVTFWVLTQVKGVDTPDDTAARRIWVDHLINSDGVGFDQWFANNTGNNVKVKFSEHFINQVNSIADILSGTVKTDSTLQATDSLVLSNGDRTELREFAEWHDEHHTGILDITGYQTSGSEQSAGDIYWTGNAISIDPLNAASQNNILSKVTNGKLFRMKVSNTQYREGKVSGTPGIVVGKISFSVASTTVVGSAIAEDTSVTLEVESNIPARDEFATVAFSGNYNDLTNRPTIPPTVTANPSGTDGSDLTRLQIGSTNYNLAGGGWESQASAPSNPEIGDGWWDTDATPPTPQTISTDNPQPVGTATPGTTGDVSDAGHVHAYSAISPKGIRRTNNSQPTGSTTGSLPGLSVMTVSYTPSVANARLWVKVRLSGGIASAQDNDYIIGSVRVKRGTGNYKNMMETADGYSAFLNRRQWQYWDNGPATQYSEFMLEPQNNTDEVKVNMTIGARRSGGQLSVTGTLNPTKLGHNTGPSYIEIYEMVAGGTMTYQTTTTLDSA